MAATPVAPSTRGTTMWPAPFLELPAALLAAVFGLTVDAAAADEAEGCVVAPDPLVAAAVEAAPEAAEPLITAWTVELKVPVMPLRLLKSLGGELE